MNSPKGSSKHSLVTYNSDISDDEHHNEEPRDAFNDISDLMSISPATIDSSVENFNETSPKDKIVEEIPKKKFKKPISSNSLRNLVSYGMDEDDDDDDDNDDNRSFVEEEEEVEEDSQRPALYKDTSIITDDNTQNPPPLDNEEFFNTECRESDTEIDNTKHDKPDNDLKSHSGLSSSKVKATVVTERPKGGSDLAYLLSRQIYNSTTSAIVLPPPSQARPSPELEQKIAELRAKVLSSGYNPTEAILKNKAYRNPSIYEKLIQHMKIDERGTNYPPELYDPYRFGEESYYEVLAKNQDSAERKRLEQEANGNTSGGKVGNKSSSNVVKTDLKGRKTKWDTGSSKQPAIAKSYSSSAGGINIETKTMYPVHK